MKGKDELCHHGILGQKWGIRRFQNKDGSLTNAGKRRYEEYSDDYKVSRDIKKKGVKSMSNSELRTLTERLQLEENYKRLNPNVVKRGMAMVGTVAATLGSVLLLTNNSSKVIDLGKSACKTAVAFLSKKG